MMVGDIRQKLWWAHSLVVKQLPFKQWMQVRFLLGPPEFLEWKLRQIEELTTFDIFATSGRHNVISLIVV